MKRRFLTVLSACVLLASCGSPADNIAFKAPDNWNSTPGIMGRVKLWIKNDQFIVLVKGDKNMTFSDATKSAPNANINTDLSSKTVTLCGSQKAQYFTGTGQSNRNGKSERETIEGTYTQIGNDKYLAMYIRPASMQADNAAEDAIHSLCPK